MGYREQQWRREFEDRSEEIESPELVEDSGVPWLTDWSAVAIEIRDHCESEWPLRRFFSWCQACEALAKNSRPQREDRELIHQGLRNQLLRLQTRDLALRLHTNEKLAKIAGVLIAWADWCPRWLARCWYISAHAQSFQETEQRKVAKSLWGELCAHEAFFEYLNAILAESTVEQSREHRDKREFIYRRLSEGSIRAALVKRIENSAPSAGRFPRREELRALARVVAALSWRLEDLKESAEREWVRHLARAKAWPELRWLWMMIRPYTQDVAKSEERGDAYQDPSWVNDEDHGPPVVESVLLGRFALAATELRDEKMLKQVAWAAPRPLGNSTVTSDVWAEIIVAATKLRVPGLIDDAFNLVYDEYRPFQHPRFGTSYVRTAFAGLQEAWPDHPVARHLRNIRASRHVEIRHIEMVLCGAPPRQIPRPGESAEATEFTGAARLCGRRLINAMVDHSDTGLEYALDEVVPLIRFPSDWRRQQMALAELITQSNGVLLGAASQWCRDIIAGSGFLTPAQKTDEDLFEWCRKPALPRRAGGAGDDLDSAYTRLRSRLNEPLWDQPPKLSQRTHANTINLVVNNCRQWVLGRAEEDVDISYLREVDGSLRRVFAGEWSAVAIRSLLRDWVKIGLFEACEVIGQTVSTAVHTWKNRAQRRYLEYIGNAESLNDMFVRSRLHYLREDFGAVRELVTAAGAPRKQRRDLWQEIRRAVERFFPTDESLPFFPPWLQPEWHKSPDLPEMLAVEVSHPEELEHAVYELLNNAYKALRHGTSDRGQLRIEGIRSRDGKFWEIVWRNPILGPITEGTGTGRRAIDEYLNKFVAKSARYDTGDRPRTSAVWETRLSFPILRRENHRRFPR